jgi:hypothetical protein
MRIDTYTKDQALVIPRTSSNHSFEERSSNSGGSRFSSVPAPSVNDLSSSGAWKGEASGSSSRPAHLSAQQQDHAQAHYGSFPVRGGAQGGDFAYGQHPPPPVPPPHSRAYRSSSESYGAMRGKRRAIFAGFTSLS